MSEKIKISKPDKFDGTDLSLGHVTAWAFSVEEYMELAGIPDALQTRLAGTWLSGDAKVWYINTYKDVKPLPALAEFIVTFKEYHQVTNGEADIIDRVETIHQDQRTVNQFCAEFKLLINQLGKGKSDLRWVHRHFLRGINKRVRSAMVPHLGGEETLDELVKKACNIARNYEFGKSLENQSQPTKPRYSSPRPSGNNTSSSTSTPAKSKSGRFNKFTTKLSDSDRDHLRNNNGCFNCRQINVDHISSNCPERAQ